MNTKLEKNAFGLIIGLSVQYVLGMITNLYVTFPDSQEPEQLWSFAKTQIPLILHIVLGIFILIGSIALIIRSIKSKEKSWIIVSIIGFTGILLSIVTGSEFVTTQNDLFSFLMALGFIISVLAYGYGGFKLRKPDSKGE